MAALNQEIYIGSVENPLFYFDKDHIQEPTSMQGVDLIGEVLSIDTFEPTVLYEGSDYETLRTIPYGTQVYYFINQELVYKFFVKEIQRTSRIAFKLNCISAIGILDKLYHSGGVYYGTSFASVAKEVISGYYAETAADDVIKTAYGVEIHAETDIITFNGASSSAFIFDFGNAKPLSFYSNLSQYFQEGQYYLYLNSGSTYQINLELLSGTVTKSGTTYNPGDELNPSIINISLMADGASELTDRYLFADTGSSSIEVLNEEWSSGLIGYVYPGVQFNNAVFSIYLKNLNEIPYSMSPEVGSTKIFGWLPYDTCRNNLHQILFATNISVLKDENCNPYFDFLKNPETPPVIPDNNLYIDGSVEYPAIPTEINLTEHSYQYDDNVERVNVIDNTSSSASENGMYIFNNAPIVVSSLRASETVTILYANENYAIIDGIGTVSGIPYYDRQTVITRNYNSTGEKRIVNVENATLVTAMNSSFVIDRLMSYYTSAKIVKGNVRLNGERTGIKYRFKDAFGEEAIGYLKKMTLYPSSFIKADCEFVTGYSPENFGNMYEYHIAIENPGILHVPAGTKRMLITMIGGGDGGSSGCAALDPDIDFVTNPYSAYDVPEAGKGGNGGEPGYGGRIYEFLLNNPVSGDYTCFLGLGGNGGEENDQHETNNAGGFGIDTALTGPNSVRYSTDSSNAYRSEYGIMDLFTGVVYGRRGHIGVKGGDGGRGNNAGPGEAGEDVTFNGITHKGGRGGDGVNFTFKRESRTAKGGGAGGGGAQAFADGPDGTSAEIYMYSDRTDAYNQQSSTRWWSAAEFVSIGGGHPQSIYPVYQEMMHGPGDGGDAGHGGAGRGGYGGMDLFKDQYDGGETSASKILQSMLTASVPIIASFSSVGLAGGDGKQGAIFIYSDKPLTFTPNILEIPLLINRTNPSSSQNVELGILTSDSNVTIEIQRRDIESNTWTIIGTTHCGLPNTEVSYIDTRAELGYSYEYRIRALGLGYARNSQYSNTVISGYGASKLTAPIVTASQQSYGILVSWQAIGLASSYVVAARRYDDDEWTYTTTDETSMSLYEDGLNLYYFKVLSFREDKTYLASDWSPEVTATTPAHGKVPTPVITYGAYAERGGVQSSIGVSVKWDQAIASCADYYIVEQKSSQATEWSQSAIVENPVEGSCYIEFFVRNGEQYSYRIKGYREGWTESDYSATYVVTIDRKLSTPTLVTFTDTGADQVALALSCADIDSRANRIYFEVSVNGGAWESQGFQYLADIPAPEYDTLIIGGACSFGGNIKVRAYVWASNYNRSDDSNVLEITIKERVYFFASNTAYPQDPSGLTGGWQTMACKWSNTDNYQVAPSASISTSGGSRTMTVTAGNGTGMYRTVNNITVTGYSKMCATGTVTFNGIGAKAAYGGFSLTAYYQDGQIHYTFNSVTQNAWFLVGGTSTGSTTEVLNPSATLNSSTSYQPMFLGFAVSGYNDYDAHGTCTIKAVFAIKK